MTRFDIEKMIVNPQDIILKIQQVVMGKPPGAVVDALLAAAATCMQLTSTFEEEDFVERAREIWKVYKEREKNEKPGDFS